MFPYAKDIKNTFSIRNKEKERIPIGQKSC